MSCEMGRCYKSIRTPWFLALGNNIFERINFCFIFCQTDTFLKCRNKKCRNSKHSIQGSQLRYFFRVIWNFYYKCHHSVYWIFEIFDQIEHVLRMVCKVWLLCKNRLPFDNHIMFRDSDGFEPGVTSLFYKFYLWHYHSIRIFYVSNKYYISLIFFW